MDTSQLVEVLFCCHCTVQTSECQCPNCGFEHSDEHPHLKGYFSERDAEAVKAPNF